MSENRCKIGGQFAPESGGQFGAELGGQFKTVSGGQYHRNFQLIQVCEEIHSDNKDREMNGLLEAMDFFKMKEGFILTKNQRDNLHFEKRTIQLIPAFEFMTQTV